MDIYKYVNSKDIREHLKKINYQFNTIEAAYIVAMCRSITLEEKLSAWKKIVATMPDMSPEIEMPNCRFDYYPDSIHAFQNALIENETKKLNEYLFAAEGAFHLTCYNRNKKRVLSDGIYGVLTTTAEEMKTKLAAILKDDNEFREISSYFITCSPKNSNSVFDVHYTRDGGIMSIDMGRKEDPLFYQFEQMWFGFPMPFKKGDIVYDPRYPDSNDMACGPFVYEQSAADYYKERGINGGCDFTDMCVSGYFQDDDGTLYADNTDDEKLCLEYYPIEKLKGVQRILIALSNYVKGEIDAILFANAYHYFLLEEQTRQSKPFAYTAEGLKLVGLMD